MLWAQGGDGLPGHAALSCEQGACNARWAKAGVRQLASNPPNHLLACLPPLLRRSKRDAAQLGQQLWQQLQTQRYLGQQAAALAEPLHEVAPGGLLLLLR